MIFCDLDLAFPKMIDLLSGHVSNPNHNIVSTSHANLTPAAVNKSSAALENALLPAKQASSKKNNEHRSNNLAANNTAVVVLSEQIISKLNV